MISKHSALPMLALLLACCAGHPSTPAAAMEDGSPLVPLPSVPDFTRGEGWGVALGVGLEYGNAYDGADEYELEVEPAGAIQYRFGNQLLFWEGLELGWRGLLTDSLLVQVAGRLEMGREADDSDDGNLDGLDDRDNEAAGVLEMRYALMPDWRLWAAGRLMAGDADFGVLGVVAAGWRFQGGEDATGSELIAFVTAADSSFINRDFGITPSESVSSGLKPTDLGGGYRSLGLTLIDRRYLAAHVQLVSQFGFELYSSDIGDSPIAREDFELEAEIALLYHF